MKLSRPWPFPSGFLCSQFFPCPCLFLWAWSYWSSAQPFQRTCLAISSFTSPEFPRPLSHLFPLSPSAAHTYMQTQILCPLPDHQCYGKRNETSKVAQGNASSLQDSKRKTPTCCTGSGQRSLHRSVITSDENLYLSYKKSSGKAPELCWSLNTFAQRDRLHSTPIRAPRDLP